MINRDVFDFIALICFSETKSFDPTSKQKNSKKKRLLPPKSLHRNKFRDVRKGKSEFSVLIESY